MAELPVVLTVSAPRYYDRRAVCAFGCCGLYEARPPRTYPRWLAVLPSGARTPWLADAERYKPDPRPAPPLRGHGSWQWASGTPARA